ncbi:hypothetical protein [Sedimenticola sp.]|uniref:hypothetical protein n=1 Tax=Sedimenticola sp. TaxID=1940285 RepID=UPI003D096AF7
MAFLDSAPKDFWSSIGENRQTREIRAQYKSDVEYRTLAVEPRAIHCAIERPAGILLEDLANDSSFLQALKLTKTFFTDFGVRDIVRAGVRVFYLGLPNPELDTTKLKFRELYTPGILDLAEETLGEINDFQIAFDGGLEGDVRYHLRIGPYSGDEAAAHFREFVDQIASMSNANFICDLDLYESSFELPDVQLIKWFTPHLRKSKSIIESIEKLISMGVGNGTDG